MKSKFFGKKISRGGRRVGKVKTLPRMWFDYLPQKGRSWIR